MFRWLLCVVSLLLLPGPALAIDIGSVRTVTVYAYGTPEEDDRRALFARTRVSANEVVETVDGGGLHLTFLDGTDFRLGSQSRVTLDEFVYDPDGGSAQKMTITMSKGVFRFVSGKLVKSGVRINTPTALIGIRGTDFFVVVADDGSTSVLVEEGEVEVTPINADQPTLLAAGAAAVFGSGGSVTLDARVVIDDPAVTGEGGGADANVGGDSDGDSGGYN